MEKAKVLILMSEIGEPTVLCAPGTEVMVVYDYDESCGSADEEMTLDDVLNFAKGSGLDIVIDAKVVEIGEDDELDLMELTE